MKSQTSGPPKYDIVYQSLGWAAKNIYVLLLKRQSLVICHALLSGVSDIASVTVASLHHKTATQFNSNSAVGMFRNLTSTKE